MKRLASALLVVVALNTNLPVIEELQPAARVVGAQTAYAQDKDDKKDKDDKGKGDGPGPGPSGDGGGY